ncbi:TPA: hypothetical protein KXF05_004305, partial [Escherichia coli]|nr:hypothetical protein [Escherichia coli]
MPASGGFPHSPGQPGFHFPAGRASAPAPAGTPHCHRLRRRTAEGWPDVTPPGHTEQATPVGAPMRTPAEP